MPLNIKGIGARLIKLYILSSAVGMRFLKVEQERRAGLFILLTTREVIPTILDNQRKKGRSKSSQCLYVLRTYIKSDIAPRYHDPFVLSLVQIARITLPRPPAAPVSPQSDAPGPSVSLVFSSKFLSNSNNRAPLERPVRSTPYCLLRPRPASHQELGLLVQFGAFLSDGCHAASFCRNFDGPVHGHICMQVRPVTTLQM